MIERIYGENDKLLFFAMVKSQQSISEQQGKTHVKARYYLDVHGVCSNGYCSLQASVSQRVCCDSPLQVDCLYSL